MTYRVRYMRGYYESVCHSLPLFMAMGNHEGEAGWTFNGTAENVAVYGTLDRKKYFLNPVPDGSEGWEANRPGWYKPIKDLFAENRVTTFFHGHDHFFAKQDQDCLIYQLCSQPSLPNFTGPSQAADYGYFAGQILPNAGHLRLTVSPDGVKTEYVRAYLPGQETATRHNRDVSATYFTGAENCYDSLSVSSPVLWNADYSDELIYPNPSSGEVKIEFSLVGTERLYLAVFDENGRLVRRLLGGELAPAGKFQIIWDGRGDLGQRWPDGVCFFRITGPNNGVKGGKIVFFGGGNVFSFFSCGELFHIPLRKTPPRANGFGFIPTNQSNVHAFINRPSKRAPVSVKTSKK